MFSAVASTLSLTASIFVCPRSDIVIVGYVNRFLYLLVYLLSETTKTLRHTDLQARSLYH